MLLAADRATGKTTQAFAWVSHGERVDGYPGWSRVLVLPTRAAFDVARPARRHGGRSPRAATTTPRVWMRAQGCRHDTEVCLDEMNMMMDVNLFRVPGHVVAATMTAWRPWEQAEFRELGRLVD